MPVGEQHTNRSWTISDLQPIVAHQHLSARGPCGRTQDRPLPEIIDQEDAHVIVLKVITDQLDNGWE